MPLAIGDCQQWVNGMARLLHLGFIKKKKKGSTGIHLSWIIDNYELYFPFLCIVIIIISLNCLVPPFSLWLQD